jgi:uncharacterized protein Smg (DUF494 family)
LKPFRRNIAQHSTSGVIPACAFCVYLSELYQQTELFFIRGVVMAVDADKVDSAIEDVLTAGQSFMTDGIQNTLANLGSLDNIKQNENMNAGRKSGTRPLMRRCNMGGLDSNGTA